MTTNDSPPANWADAFERLADQADRFAHTVATLYIKPEELRRWWLSIGELYTEARSLWDHLPRHDRPYSASPIRVDPFGGTSHCECILEATSAIQAMLFASYSPLEDGLALNDLIAWCCQHHEAIRLIADGAKIEVHQAVAARKPLANNVGGGMVSDTPRTGYKSPTEWRAWLKESSRPSSATSWIKFKAAANGEDHPVNGDKLVRFPVESLRQDGLDPP